MYRGRSSNWKRNEIGKVCTLEGAAGRNGLCPVCKIRAFVSRLGPQRLVNAGREVSDVVVIKH